MLNLVEKIVFTLRRREISSLWEDRMKEKRENKKLKKLENKEKYQSKLERREIQTYIDNVLWVK